MTEAKPRRRKRLEMWVDDQVGIRSGSAIEGDEGEKRNSSVVKSVGLE